MSENVNHPRQELRLLLFLPGFVTVYGRVSNRSAIEKQKSAIEVVSDLYVPFIVLGDPAGWKRTCIGVFGLGRSTTIGPSGSGTHCTV
jgi:hypothetical protein